MPEALRQVDFSSSETDQGQTLALLGEEIVGILSEYMGSASTCEQTHKAQRKSLLHVVEVVEQLLAIDLVDVHGVPSARNITRVRKIAIHRLGGNYLIRKEFRPLRSRGRRRNGEPRRVVSGQRLGGDFDGSHAP